MIREILTTFSYPVPEAPSAHCTASLAGTAMRGILDGLSEFPSVLSRRPTPKEYSTEPLQVSGLIPLFPYIYNERLFLHKASYLCNRNLAETSVQNIFQPPEPPDFTSLAVAKILVNKYSSRFFKSRIVPFMETMAAITSTPFVHISSSDSSGTPGSFRLGPQTTSLKCIGALPGIIPTLSPGNHINKIAGNSGFAGILPIVLCLHFKGKYAVHREPITPSVVIGIPYIASAPAHCLRVGPARARRDGFPGHTVKRPSMASPTA